ncbi:ATP-binding cassette domain-containing protein [Nibribacter ruber]|uniref:ATP-binding cassette domain-containing protein n=1 Tax=Nibribacter ruber TaxID=2698458 RepID=A0A6P1NW84_9BACT|nr:ABC transporter ATP-binding protein [Nibribacter ruber]QHL86499.1 ATP-binding cassette domain-containing protein [Nibribacter ruber]
MNVLDLKSISLFKGDKCVLNNLNLNIHKKEICCLLGRNGAGKSSLFKTIFGIYKPQSGVIYLNGVEVSPKNRDQYLNKVGALIEGAALYEHLTGYENLDFVRRYFTGEKSRIIELLDLVGLMPDKDKKTKYYSSGMKQRLGLAMALFHKPSLVILDEPTNALDPEGISEFRSLVKRLNKVEGVSFLISTHQLEEAGYYKDHILILKEGKLVFDNALQDIQALRILPHQTYPHVAEELQDQCYWREDEAFTLLKAPLTEFPLLWDELNAPSLEDIYLAIHQQKSHATHELLSY